MEWTTQQKKVIDTKDKDILVSAAAGSGKTAVLVNRIIQKVTDKENPVNVDQMLICTFTKAAADQMREKIQKAIDEQIEQNPEDEHIVKQAGYIRSAMITTIDGFCNYIVKNYYDTIDLNPGFRIAEEAQLAILREEVMGKVLEKWYTLAKEEPDNKRYQDFLAAALSCNKDSTDKYLEEIINTLNNMASSHPSPDKWLLNMVNKKPVHNVKELDEEPIIKCIFVMIQRVIKDNINSLNMAKGICEQALGPLAYVENLESDIEIYKSFAQIKSYNELYARFQTVKFSRLKTISKNQPVDLEMKDLVKEIRVSAKKKFEEIQKKYFYMKPKRMLKINNLTNDVLSVIASVALDFRCEYEKAKVDKGVLDFGDIEHYALKILTNNGNPNEPTQVALSLSNFYDEIFVDEYQDSNDVQEAILTSIAGKNNNKPYMFMVGDVKQSIYGFRMAKPDLFLNKADTYSVTDDSDNIRIDLNKNFRSRDKVLDFCNFIFERCMTKDAGKIEYTDVEKLYVGASYPENDEDYCELLIYDTNDNDENDDEDKEANDGAFKTVESKDVDKAEAEIRIIAQRIKELTDTENGFLVTDTNEQGEQIQRIARYSDIAVLFRGIQGWSEIIYDVFSSYQIPTVLESSTGYFSSIEIRVMLNLLRIINNPLQDIPLVSVLRSPIFCFTNEELAIIKASHSKGFMYEAIVEYVNGFDALSNPEQEQLICKVKAEKFLEDLERYRSLADYMSIHELILRLFDSTGYYECVLAMSDGKKRRMNLDMLVSKARAFEKTNYCGLFNFIRFMDKLSTYSIDMGQAQNDDDIDGVRIMTIHKSKGLEFPIVFVAGTGKAINTQDSKDKIIVHRELGLGIDYINYNHRVKTKTLTKAVLSKLTQTESIDEELRILYVALTRAKEKLIVTGSINFNKVVTKNMLLSNKDMGTMIPTLKIISLKSYLELIIMTLMQTKNMRLLMEENDIYSIFADDMTIDCCVKLKLFDADYISQSMIVNRLTNDITSDYLRNFDTSIVYDEQTKNELERLDTIKVYTPAQAHKSKLSVSEIKHEKMKELEEYSDSEFTNSLSHLEKLEQKENEENNSKNEQISAAMRGTLYHKLFELLPFAKAINKSNVNKDELIEYINDFTKDCSMLSDWERIIKISDIRKFLKTDLAKRMARADSEGKLFKEQSFFMGVDARDIYTETDSDEMILIQGIIDAFFIEDGKAVLMDYKTDSIKGYTKEEGARMIAKRYASQLDLYAKAIKKATSLEVEEKIIYSVALGKAFDISDYADE